MRAAEGASHYVGCCLWPDADIMPTWRLLLLLMSCCRFVEGNTLWDNVKKIAMASFAMKATERDPDFVDNFTQVGLHYETHAESGP